MYANYVYIESAYSLGIAVRVSVMSQAAYVRKATDAILGDSHSKTNDVLNTNEVEAIGLSLTLALVVLTHVSLCTRCGPTDHVLRL